MLIQLTLHHLALVEQAELELHAGFNVITGETGAGKSLLLDALHLCIGGRVDAGLIRHGQPQAEVFAEFDIRQIPEAKKWLQEQSRDIEDNVLIRRQLIHQNDGNVRSKAWLNGSPISLTELKTFGSILVNIHSQHAQQSLLRPQFIMEWLDSATGLTEQANKVKRAFLHYESLQQQAQRQANETQLRNQQIQLLNNQLEDIEPLLGLDYTKIEAEFDELSNLETLMQQASLSVNLLNNDNDEPDVMGLLGRAIKLCESHTCLSQTYVDCVEQLYQAQHLVAEVASTLTNYAEGQSLNPERLAQLDEQLSTFHRLARKYQVNPEQLLSEAHRWQNMLDELTQIASPEKLAEQIEQAYQTFLHQANELNYQRQQHAKPLTEMLLQRLRLLALPNVQAEFSFTMLDNPNSTGVAKIELLFSANVGMPMQPMHKIASGGELSRLALVMQVIDAQGLCRQQQQVISNKPLLVFDEVDVGISGGTAQVVGKLLRELGNQQQILAITHQAQVAAMAHQHILVHKTQQEQAQSHLTILSESAQIQELARMSGGVNITQITLAHAKSLLASAKKML